MLQLLKTLQQLASAEKNTQNAKSQTKSFKNVLSCAKYEAKKLTDRSFPVASPAQKRSVEALIILLIILQKQRRILNKLSKQQMNLSIRTNET